MIIIHAWTQKISPPSFHLFVIPFCPLGHAHLAPKTPISLVEERSSHQASQLNRAELIRKILTHGPHPSITPPSSFLLYLSTNCLLLLPVLIPEPPPLFLLAPPCTPCSRLLAPPPPASPTVADSRRTLVPDLSSRQRADRLLPPHAREMVCVC